jgi:hypothetical protein
MMTYSAQCSKLLAANGVGLSHRQLQRLNAKDRNQNSNVLNLDPEAVRLRLQKWYSDYTGATESADGQEILVSLAFDATKVPSVIENVQIGREQYQIGYQTPYHFLTAEEAEKVNSDPLMKKSVASELKVCLITTQHFQNGVSPMLPLSARPSSTNESCDDFAESSMKAIQNHDKCRLISVSFDGAKSDAWMIRLTTAQFLAGKFDVVGLTDANHVGKALRGQFVHGSSVQSLGITYCKYYRVFAPGSCYQLSLQVLA